MLPTVPSEDKPEARRFNARDCLQRTLDGHPLPAGDAARLLALTAQDDLRRLQEAAHELRQRQCSNEVPFAVQQSIILTNQCELENVLYDYARPAGARGAFTLTIDDIDERLELAAARNADQIFLTQGGFWSELTLPGLESATLLKSLGRLLEHIRERRPETPLIGFSPDEIEFLRIVSDRSPRYVMEFLKDKGLRMLGGLHTYVLDDTVRRRISPRLAPAKTWKDIVAQAATLKLPVIAALGYGHFETSKQRIEHLEQLATLQRRQPGAFSRLVPEPLARPVEVHGLKPPDLAERRKVQALCRLFAGDALPVQQTTWALHAGAAGEAQELLAWGASDMGPSDALSWPAFLNGSHESASMGAGELQGLISESGHTARRQPFTFGL